MVVKKDVQIEPIGSEIDDYYSDDDIFSINSWGADLSFRELITMYEEGELIKPELQRYYVWDKSEASWFIESLLLGLPVPSIFLAKARRERKLIIDGYQRIMTVYDYCRGIFGGDNTIFKLSNSEKINKRWRGKAFVELSEQEQRRIRSTTIHAIIFEQRHPRNSDTSLFQIFERINTTGRTLMPQEIRNCAYQGPFNTLLLSLNEKAEWRALYGSPNIDSRMRDTEFILRFLALSETDFQKIDVNQISMKKFLNDFMGDQNSTNKGKLAKRRDRFQKVIKYVHANIGLNAFRNISEKDETRYATRFHPTIFDAVTCATALALPQIGDDVIPKLEKKRVSLLKDDTFNEYISIRTTNIDHIEGRISLALKYLYNLDYE